MIHSWPATVPASPDRPNEDFAAVTPDAAVLLDGAGAADLDNGCRHGVAWFTRRLGGAILGRVADGALPDVLASAISTVADEHRDTCDLDDPGSPSATVIIARFTSSAMEYLLMADSVLLVGTASAPPLVLTDARVEAVGNRYRAAMDRLPTGTPSHLAARREFVRATLAHRNRPGGYWVASADPSVAAEAVTGSVPLAGVDAIALLSDGATRLVDTFALDSWAGLMATLASAGPDELLRRTRAAELSDPAGERWPRAKTHDDATAIYLALDATPAA